jgi:RNA polymerase sigma factor (sigma-70 family)
VVDSPGIRVRAMEERGHKSSAAVRPSASLADGELIGHAIRGDRAAFALLYDRHLDRVYRHCYYLCGNRVDAEDLAQQTFLQAWRAIGRYRSGRAPFLAWLFTISHNLSISARRKQREILNEQLLMSSVCPRSDPEGEVLSDITRDVAWQAIRQLRPERQQIVILRYIEGFSIAEVASTTGKSETNVSVIQHRAMNDLRRIMMGPPAGNGFIDERAVAKLRNALTGRLKKQQRP